MAAKVEKWVEKENFDFDGLKLTKNCNKPVCKAHCWKAYLIGYNFIMQKIALKCKPEFSRFFCKISQNPVFCPYLSRGAF